jgi:hypothetical protein
MHFAFMKLPFVASNGRPQVVLCERPLPLLTEALHRSLSFRRIEGAYEQARARPPNSTISLTHSVAHVPWWSSATASLGGSAVTPPFSLLTQSWNRTEDRQHGETPSYDSNRWNCTNSGRTHG